MSNRPILVLLAAAILATTALAEDDPVLAKAGEHVYRQSNLDRLVSYSPQYLQKKLQENPEQKIMLVTRIMQQKILSDIARKEGFDEKADVKEQLQYIVDDFIASEYIKQVARKNAEKTSVVPEEDLEKYYKHNRNVFSLPERVRVRHILIKVPSGSPEDARKEAEEKIKAIRDRLERGEVFETLAKQYSEDPVTREKGGDTGFFPRGRMEKPFEEAAFSLKPGQASGIVETSFGYHIMELEEHKEARVQTYDEVRDYIEKQVKERLVEAGINDFIRQAGKAAGLEIHKDTIQKGSNTTVPVGR